MQPRIPIWKEVQMSTYLYSELKMRAVNLLEELSSFQTGTHFSMLYLCCTAELVLPLLLLNWYLLQLIYLFIYYF